MSKIKEFSILFILICCFLLFLQIGSFCCFAKTFIWNESDIEKEWVFTDLSSYNSVCGQGYSEGGIVDSFFQIHSHYRAVGQLEYKFDSPIVPKEIIIDYAYEAKVASCGRIKILLYNSKDEIIAGWDWNYDEWGPYSWTRIIFFGERKNIPFKNKYGDGIIKWTFINGKASFFYYDKELGSANYNKLDSIAKIVIQVFNSCCDGRNDFYAKIRSIKIEYVSKMTNHEIEICISKNQCEQYFLDQRFLFFVPPKDMQKIVGVNLLFLNDEEKIYPVAYRVFSPYVLAIMKALSDVYKHDNKILCESSLVKDLKVWLRQSIIPIDIEALPEHLFKNGYDKIIILPIVLRKNKLQTTSFDDDIELCKNELQVNFDDGNSVYIFQSSPDSLAAYILSGLGFIFGAEKCPDGLRDCIYSDSDDYELDWYKKYLEKRITNLALDAIIQCLPKPYKSLIQGSLSANNAVGILWNSWNEYSTFVALKKIVEKQDRMLNLLVGAVRNTDELKFRGFLLHNSFLNYLESFNATSLNIFSDNVMLFAGAIENIFLEKNNSSNLYSNRDSYIYALLPLYLIYSYQKNLFSVSISEEIREFISDNGDFWDFIHEVLEFFLDLIPINFGDDSCNYPYYLFNLDFKVDKKTVIKGESFSAKIELDDFLGTSNMYSNVYLSVSSGSINPSTISLLNGTWQGQVIIDDTTTDEVIIKAESTGVVCETRVEVHCSAPSVPEPVYPIDDNITNQSSLFFSWNVSKGAHSRYEFQLASNESFSEVLYEARDITSAFLNVPIINLDKQLQPGAIYYWRVRAVNECGPSGWSKPASFSVPEVEPQITITLPEDGATLTAGEEITITWDYQGDVGETVKIRYNTGGRHWSTIATGVPVTDGSCSWTVPNKATTRLRIKIESEQDRTIYDIGGFYTIEIPE